MISWVTVIWSMAIAACLTLAAIHFLIWLRNRSEFAHLFFALLATSFAAFSACEYLAMRSTTIAGYATVHRLAHVPMFFVVVLIVGFIGYYFRTGWRWLFWTVVALRLLVLVLAFYPGPTFNYREILALESFSLLGEPVTVAQGVPRAWARIGELSALLALVYVVSASIGLWRRGGRRERQRALIVGGSVVLCIASAVTFSLLLHTGKIQAPYVASLSFLLIIGAMGYDLSRDVVDAGRLAADLRGSSEDMRLAADAAQIGFWRWDIASDSIWMSPLGRRLHGMANGEEIDLEGFLKTVHPDDRGGARETLGESSKSGGGLSASFRVVQPDGSLRWIDCRGKCDLSNRGTPQQIRGISVDVTAQTQIENEARDLRRELAEASHAALLGQVASALVHELGQPLGAILRNAEAAEILLDQSPPDVTELRAIVQDIHSDDARATAVIRRLRSVFAGQSPEVVPLPLDEIAREARSLLLADSKAKQVTLRLDVAGHLNPVWGDRVLLIQLLLNLISNSMEAITEDGSSVSREVLVAAEPAGESGVRVRVTDTGPGFSAEALAQLFDPFYSSKANGMGMGLPIAKTIADAHGGTIEAANRPEGGAEVSFTLPAAGGPDR